MTRPIHRAGVTFQSVTSSPNAPSTVEGKLMETKPQPAESWLALSLDLWSGRSLVWIASVGRDAELTTQAHRYFFDRYQRLAEYYRARGRFERAQRCRAKAEEHDIPGDNPPYAAAMAMPRPRRFVRTNAVAGRPRGFDDAA
jgi:hypothetical protein